MRVLPMRLRPGEELKGKLAQVVREKSLHAGFILTCVGSVDAGVIRLASPSEKKEKKEGSSEMRMLTIKQPYEITSLVGTLSRDGSHLHVTLSDDVGRTVAGHVVSLRIFTTAEIVCGDCDGYSFSREMDPSTGFKELVITEKSRL